MARPVEGPWDRACRSGLQGKRIPDEWIEQYFLYAAKRMRANANANADDRTGLNAKTGAKPDEQLACGIIPIIQKNLNLPFLTPSILNLVLVSIFSLCVGTLVGCVSSLNATRKISKTDAYLTMRENAH